VTEAIKDWEGISTPDVSGGITTDLKYKNFSLSLLFNYQLGGQMYDGGYADLMTAPTGSAVLGSNKHVDILKRWQKKGDITNIPRLEKFDDANQNAGTSNRWLISSDMLELANATLNYTLPKAVVNQFGIHGLRFYVSADNALLFTKRQGIYPRKNIFSGYAGNPDVYLPARVYTLGLNLTF
jgi:hypothetical protein